VTGERRVFTQEATAEFIAKYAGGPKAAAEIVERRVEEKLREEGISAFKSRWEKWTRNPDGSWGWASVEPTWMYQVRGIRYRFVAVEIL